MPLRHMPREPFRRHDAITLPPLRHYYAAYAINYDLRAMLDR